MTYFIPILAITVSVFGIFSIVIKHARSVSSMGHDELEDLDYGYAKEEKAVYASENDIVYNIISKASNVRGEGVFLVFMEKFFRRARVRLMKLENFLTNISNSLHEKNKRKLDPFASDTQGVRGAAVLGESSLEFDEQYWLGVIKHDSGNTHAYKKLGEIYTTRQDFRQARYFLNYVLKLDPDNTDVKGKIKEIYGKKTVKK